MQIGGTAPVPQTAIKPDTPAPKPQQETAKAPFEPAPPLRPTLQDKIDVNRALRFLREV